MTVAVSDTTGNVAITHAGSTNAITWTAAGGFDFVGAITLDGITQAGNVSMDGATMLFDGSTSVRGVSAGFVSLESPANRFGSDAAVYMQIATTGTTGVTAITHTGTGPTVTWTANSFDLVGALTVDGVTISGDIDSAGKADFDYNPPTGSSNGHILKSTLTTATAYSGTTAGLQVKSYFADNAVTVTGGEFTGVYVNVKQLAAMAGGAKSSIISGHNYGSGGDYQYLDYGCILYGDLTWGYVLSGGTSTYGLYFGDQTISTADIYLQNGETISNATDGELDFSSASLQVNSQPVVLNTRHRVTVAEINAGHEILPAITGRTYRIIDVTAIAYGGAVGTTTTVDVLGTQGTGSVKLVTFAQADLVQSAVLTIAADGTVLADGASFVACDANTAITVGKTGSDADTATGVDFIITYVIE